ncbi:MAG: hypothetical protein Q9163_003438 [Psora crenata]
MKLVSFCGTPEIMLPVTKLYDNVLAIEGGIVETCNARIAGTTLSSLLSEYRELRRGYLPQNIMVPTLENEIIGLEHKTWRALQRSGRDLLPFLAKDCCMLFPGGTIFSAASSPSLEEILLSPDMKPWTSYTLDAIRVLDLGKDSKAVCYVVEAKRKEDVYNALITSIWRKGTTHGGDWELVLHQQTPT